MRVDPLRAFDGFVRVLRVQGSATGPLAGTTFAAKDLFDVRGVPTGAGNPDWERTHPVPATTAPAVEALLAAGATLAGKTCSDELAFSLDGVNVHFGTPVNPRFPDRLPGGSSSGSASAVAAGLVDFALGTDTSGSIRVPASYCGLLGFRPTHGAIALDGVVPLAPSFDTVGWLARDAAMLARCGRVLLRGDEAPRAGGVRRICVVLDAFDLVDPRCAAEVAAAVGWMRHAVAQHADVRFTGDALASWVAAFSAIKQWEAWQAHGAWIEATRPDFGPDIRANFEAAARVSEAGMRQARARRDDIRAAIGSYLDGETVLCLPSTWTIAPLRTASPAERAANRAKALTICAVAGLAGAPQVSLPVAAAGRAIGLSLIGAPGRDLALLDLAVSLAPALG